MNKLSAGHDVLLAEDDMDDVEIFIWALTKAEIPHDLRHAKDGKHLFVLLKENIPYILFLDIELPCLDGISCIMEIRKNREYDRMPVIIYSSHANARYIESAYRNSASYFLTKTHAIDKTVDHLKTIFAKDWNGTMYYPSIDDFLLA